VFASLADNLVIGDTNGFVDMFVRDRSNGTTQRISVSSTGAESNGSSYSPSISADGRYVAFWSLATNLVPGASVGQIFVRDLQSGTIEIASLSSSGVQSDVGAEMPSISADGRYVAFKSASSMLVAGDTNGVGDIFVRDRLNGTTERVSVDSNGVEANNVSDRPAISADGRCVVFESDAHNLVPGAIQHQIYVHDRQTGTTEMASMSSSGEQGGSFSLWPAISGDGRYVAFSSSSSNLVPGDTNGCTDIFVRDRLTATTERVSLTTGGGQADHDCLEPSISADGRYVAFCAAATNLAPGDTNFKLDIYARDRKQMTTERVSTSSNGTQGDQDSRYEAITPGGRFVAFKSFATNLTPGDTNGWGDVFVRDRNSSGFTSLCDAGVAGVVTCPCSNPPSAPGRGCDNSSASGGATLSAAGIAYLSMDSLVFTTAGEKPAATSIVMQGTTLVANGLVFGQGVRCVGGMLKRLYTKTAVAGSITAPDFGAGDPMVSSRSAALGDPISAGQSRWYLVYYRDPVVLGGCSANSTFNATQTGQVTWWP
jgi:Tol biopolymer transport system component